MKLKTASVGLFIIKSCTLFAVIFVILAILNAALMILWGMKTSPVFLVLETIIIMIILGIVSYLSAYFTETLTKAKAREATEDFLQRLKKHTERVASANSDEPCTCGCCKHTSE